MGGSTAINALSLRPDLFAAGISIAGIPQFDKIDKLSNIPIWLIHGTDDTENPIDSDDEFYKELSGYNKIRFWRLKNKTHDNVFSIAILKETLPQWLFKQKK
jgi:predicted peptidase